MRLSTLNFCFYKALEKCAWTEWVSWLWQQSALDLGQMPERECVRVFSSWRECTMDLHQEILHCHGCSTVTLPFLAEWSGLKSVFLKVHLQFQNSVLHNRREVLSFLSACSKCTGSQKSQVQIQMGLTNKLSYMQLILQDSWKPKSSLYFVDL